MRLRVIRAEYLLSESWVAYALSGVHFPVRASCTLSEMKASLAKWSDPREVIHPH